MFEIYSVDQDKVINAAVGVGKTTYGTAIKHLYPLIDQLAIQRKLQDPKFYERLKRDIKSGCIMPPITIAFITQENANLDNLTTENLKKYINQNIESGFILDGIQRLNTLQRAITESKDEKTTIERYPLYFNVIICKTMDSLLYRMITLNNGQRGMTTRHQIEIVTSNMYDFSDSDLPIETEKKHGRRKGLFKKADFVLAYLAFLSNSTTVDSQKLIEEKLDQLIAFKILESNPLTTEVEFSEILSLIEKFCGNPENKQWFKNQNNLIGFTSGIKNSFKELKQTSTEEFNRVTHEFELAFNSFSVSKIKLGQARRNAVHWFISHYGEFSEQSHIEMMGTLAAHI